MSEVSAGIVLMPEASAHVIFPEHRSLSDKKIVELLQCEALDSHRQFIILIYSLAIIASSPFVIRLFKRS